MKNTKNIRFVLLFKIVQYFFTSYAFYEWNEFVNALENFPLLSRKKEFYYYYYLSEKLLDQRLITKAKFPKENYDVWLPSEAETLHGESFSYNDESNIDFSQL